MAIFAISALFFTALMRWVEAPFITDAETEAVEEIGPKAPAIDTKGFLAGDIISDDVFRNSHSMSQEQVEAFISEVNEGCVTGFDGTDCIADARFATEDLPADGWCAGNYRGEPAESAASIIIKASLACQINPQVILAMLQKEQSLLTASGENLGQSRYIAAMGYGCPDHTNCDPTFAG
ncbi:MAG: hypothetical protein Q4C87_11975, partial [Actinomycetaceae bacterium]|nr:hypothetical protein [Actinomycetaceae bacterium]